MGKVAKKQPRTRNFKQETKTITPAMAARLLKTNAVSTGDLIRNRNVNQRTVARYAAQMSKGLWMVNGESIKVDYNGKLFDGQHRLWACIEAGKPFKTAFHTGLPPEAATTVDTGPVRKPKDILYMHGCSYCTALAASLSLYRLYEDGALYSGTARDPLLNQEVIPYYEKHKALSESIKKMERWKVKDILTLSVGSTLHYIFSQGEPDFSDLFFEALGSPAGHEIGSPVLALREKLISIKMNKSRDARVPREFLIVITVKSWNGFMSGSQIKNLYWGQKESVPKIKGIKGGGVRQEKYGGKQ
jgi:hypothetical protein